VLLKASDWSNQGFKVNIKVTNAVAITSLSSVLWQCRLE